MYSMYVCMYVCLRCNLCQISCTLSGIDTAFCMFICMCMVRYCIVRPGGLGKGEPTGVINVIDGQAGSIQRAGPFLHLVTIPTI